MKFKEYLTDKIPQILFSLFFLIIMILILNAFKVVPELKLTLIIIYTISILFNIFYAYFQKYSFYHTLTSTIANLDKKYLVLEMIAKPSFCEGQIFYETLYEINKSMIEDIKEYNLSITDFKEYVEMWIHEVKIPISSLILLNHNHQTDLDKKYLTQIRKLDNYIDQILYYVRSENAEKDYIIREKELREIIKNVALKNKDDLLENNVKLEVDLQDEKVLTDHKWLEFILNQIINNSIKYRNQEVQSLIRISSVSSATQTTLIIYDNGIGISKKDLPRVFTKSFTGENGRLTTKSTGMGLYIAKNLCTKLGHQIKIESKVGEYTQVSITFAKNDFYKFDN